MFLGLIVGLFIGKGSEGIILLSHLIGGTNELPNPMLVRASQVGKIVLGWNPKTAANWRCQKVGPRYYQDDLGSIYYKVDEIIEFFTRHQVQTKDCSILTLELEK